MSHTRLEGRSGRGQKGLSHIYTYLIHGPVSVGDCPLAQCSIPVSLDDVPVPEGHLPLPRLPPVPELAHVDVAVPVGHLAPPLQLPPVKLPGILVKRAEEEQTFSRELTLVKDSFKSLKIYFFCHGKISL